MTPALSFDGKDDYVEIPTLKYDGTYPITIEARITPLSRDGFRTVIGDWGWSFRGEQGVVMHSEGCWGFGLCTDRTDNYLRADSQKPTKIDRTIHLASVFDSKQVRIYVDGKLAGTNDQIKKYMPSTRHFLLGACWKKGGGTQDYINGILDEVRISNTPRYTKDFTPQRRFEPDEHTLALYHFDQGSGTVLTDASGNNHHGEIHGTEWTKQGTTVLERQAAEWVLTNGGSLMISVNGAPEVAIKSEAALPRKNFQIEGINLRDTKIGDAGPAHVKRLTNLHSLNLINTQIGDVGLAELKGLTDLQSLWLTRTQISDAGLAQLMGMKNLQRLVINVSQIGDAGLAELKGLTNLQELDLSYTRVSDAGLAELKGLTNLQRLWLGSKNISDASLVHLKELNNLRFLDLVGTKLTDAGLAALKKALPRCQVSRR